MKERRRYSNDSKCVASVSWGRALSVGIQHTDSIDLAVNIFFLVFIFIVNYSIIFSGPSIDNIFPNTDPFYKCKNRK